MLTLFTLGRSLLICFRCILSVEEYITQKKDKSLVDPDPNLLYTKRKQARQSDSPCPNTTSFAISVSSDGNSESCPQNGSVRNSLRKHATSHKS